MGMVNPSVCIYCEISFQTFHNVKHKNFTPKSNISVTTQPAPSADSCKRCGKYKFLPKEYAFAAQTSRRKFTVLEK
jgi:hypothetical protein